MIINYIDIEEINYDNYKLLRNAVSQERRIRADSFYFVDDAKRCICAELLLQYILFKLVGSVVDLDIGYNKYGKPFLKHKRRFSYNLSHSGKWVVIAYGTNEIGIDIEKIQSGREYLADKLFTEDERNYIYLGIGKEQTERFTQIWTLKESYIKFLGTGLSTSLSSFSINAVLGEVTNQKGELQKHLILKNYLFDTDYFLSICSIKEDIAFHEIKLNQLMQFIKKV